MENAKGKLVSITVICPKGHTVVLLEKEAIGCITTEGVESVEDYGFCGTINLEWIVCPVCKKNNPRAHRGSPKTTFTIPLKEW